MLNYTSDRLIGSIVGYQASERVEVCVRQLHLHVELIVYYFCSENPYDVRVVQFQQDFDLALNVRFVGFGHH